MTRLISSPNNNIEQCSVLPYIDLGIFNNTNELKFDLNTQYGGWRNPNALIFWGDFPLNYTVKLQIWNADGTNYQPIGVGQWNFTTTSGPKEETLDKSGSIERFVIIKNK